MFIASTHEYILFFTDMGRCYWLKVFEIPEGGRATRGKSIANLVSKEQGETIVSYVAVKDFDAPLNVLMVTETGEHQEDAAQRVQQSAQDRHRGDRAGQEGRAHRRASHGRQAGRRHRHIRRHGDPVPRDRSAHHGPCGRRRACHPARQERCGRRCRGAAPGRYHDPRCHGERVREAERHGRVPHQPSRRQGYLHDEDHREDRARWWRSGK